jgi:hypothetical protein
VRVIALAAVLFLVAVSTSYGSSRGAAGASRSATINSDGFVPIGQVLSVSCGAPGDCLAGGYYRDGIGHRQAFVVGETNGEWGNAMDVPGTATLNSGGSAGVNSVSCAAVGDCTVGGYYADRKSALRSQAFVVSETNGKWGTAIEVPGTATLNTGARAQVNSISCPDARDCTASGFYTDKQFFGHAFVVDKTNGSWGNATEVLTGTGTDVAVNSVSCGAAGECAAVGSEAWPRPSVVSETNGSWGNAMEVPGLATLSPNGYGWGTAISCAAVGECAAGGWLRGAYGDNNIVFVVSETNGSWGNAMEVPGMATLDTYGGGTLSSLSCGAPGECAAGGSYHGPHGFKAFVVSETNGNWGNAIEVPGDSPGSAYASAAVDSMSCSPAGDCAAGGEYDDGAFVVSGTNGNWGNAMTVQGIATPYADVNSISCPAAGDCAAVGNYHATDGQPHAFVVSETNGTWDNAIPVRLPFSCHVPKVAGDTIVAAKTRLNRDHCGLGKITRVFSDRKNGLVVEQETVPGEVVAPRTPVALNVSKGKQPTAPTRTRWRATVAKLPAGAARGKKRAVDISSISCASPGNCTAVGSYADNAGHQEGLLLTETAGHWARGVEPILPADAWSGGAVSLDSVSCASAGNCTAVGTYSTGDGGIYGGGGGRVGLLLTEKGGQWAAGVEARLPANAALPVELHSVSCASAGNCTAVGNSGSNGLLLTEEAGHWRRGVTTQYYRGTDPAASDLTSVSCSSDGSCSAVGYYTYTDDPRFGYAAGVGVLLTKKRGTWHRVSNVVLPPDGPGESFVLSLVSCVSRGNCSVAGTYNLGIDEASAARGVLLTERAGRWRRGVTATPPKNARSGYFGNYIDLVGISCGAPEHCVAIGPYYDAFGRRHAALLTEAGRWRRGVEPILPSDAKHLGAVLSAVSCASAGSCTVVGSYDAGSTIHGKRQRKHGLLLTEIAGSWAQGVEAPRSTAILSVSCASPGNCGAVGSNGVLLDSTTPLGPTRP